MFKAEVEIPVTEADSFMIEQGGNPDINDRGGDVCLRTVEDMFKLALASQRAMHINPDSNAELRGRHAVFEARMERVGYMVRRYLEIVEQAHGIGREDELLLTEEMKVPGQ